MPTNPQAAAELLPVETRRKLTHPEQMADAEAQCVPCRLCGGKAVITDAGLGAGYYIACENGSTFKASDGCLINERRLGGWAYNVMEWWNRLQSQPSPEHGRGDVERVARGIAKAMDEDPDVYWPAYQVEAQGALAALQPAPRQEGEGVERVAVDGFSRLTLEHNIETVLRDYRDAHPDTMKRRLMSVIPRAALHPADRGDEVAQIMAWLDWLKDTQEDQRARDIVSQIRFHVARGDHKQEARR